MFQYHCLNPIAEKGLGLFDEDYKKTEELEGTDAILVRSAKMHDMELPESVKVIARAGAGVNNIPVKDCAEKGIVVFNTPGANANGVKELVLAGMLLASRDIVGGIEWVAKEKDQEDMIVGADPAQAALVNEVIIQCAFRSWHRGCSDESQYSIYQENFYQLFVHTYS